MSLRKSMKSRRYVAYALLVLVLISVQIATEASALTMVLVMSIVFFVFWEYFDKKNELLVRKENKELQEKVKSSAKDAHLNYKQLLTVVSSIPFPLLLLDPFGNIVMSSNVDEISEGEIQENMTYANNSFVYPVQEFIKDCFIMERAMDTILHIQGIEYQSICVPVTAKGKYRGCLLLFQDVSKTLEGEKMQKRFIADASHELKKPIAVIKGMVEILKRDNFDDPQMEKEFLTQIESEINRLDGLVKDLLILSRLSLSNVLLTKEFNDMNEIINKAIQSFKKQINEKGLKLVCDYQYQSPIRCDAMKMSQVIINLLSNAIQYSDQGTIRIQTYRENNFFVCTVADEGQGIAKENLDKIFHRFYRVDDARTRSKGGSGLGLSIVKSTVEAHGGNVEVDSELNKGTKFIVRIPL